MKKQKIKSKIKLKQITHCPADSINQGDFFKNEEGWVFECVYRANDKLQGNRAYDDHANTYKIGSKKYKKLVKITRKEYREFLDAICI